MTHRKISDRQKRFVREYMVDLNATQAAIRAGYSRRSASQRGWALRRHPAVATRIEAAMADRDEAAGITAERVLSELARLSFANIQDYLQPGETGGGGWVDPATLTREQAAAVTALEMVTDSKVDNGAPRLRVRLADKSRGLELIGRYLGLFPRLPAAKKAEEKTDVQEEPVGELMSDLEFAQRILSIMVEADKARGEETESTRATERWLDRHGRA